MARLLKPLVKVKPIKKVLIFKVTESFRDLLIRMSMVDTGLILKLTGMLLPL